MRSNPPSNIRCPKCAFSLIELLVVITIIGILISLLLPAVQAAREAARKMQCSNNLKQLALGCLNHEQAQGWLPAGGWGQDWIGNPDWGFGGKQSGGWIFNILPYLEQQTLHDLQLGRSGTPRSDAASQMIGTPLSVMNCPSRRASIAFDAAAGLTHYTQPKCADNLRASMTLKIARTDYAIDEGTELFGPTSCGAYEGVGWGPNDSTAYDSWMTSCVHPNPPPRDYDGVTVPGDVVLLAQITDGTSTTYLVGEKYLDPDSYLNGTDGGDNESMYMGDNADIGRWGGASFPPFQDRVGYPVCANFGSAHAGGFNMAFCDGSVHQIGYSIDLDIHGRLANRKDGQPIDGSNL